MTYLMRLPKVASVTLCTANAFGSLVPKDRNCGKHPPAVPSALAADLDCGVDPGELIVALALCKQLPLIIHDESFA
jgi:hypothetical protein